MGFLFITIAIAAAMSGGGYLIIHSHEVAKAREEERRLAMAGFREVLTRELRRTKASGFDFAELVARAEIDRGDADEVARELFGRYTQKVFSDGVVTDDERRTLGRLAAALQISADMAASIEAKAKEERYRKAASDAVADGVVTPEELEELERLRRSLGIGREERIAPAAKHATVVYAAHVREAFSDGVVSTDERRTLDRLAVALEISNDVAASIEAKAKGERYQRAVADAMADGVLTYGELDDLERLRQSLGVSRSEGLALAESDARAVYVEEMRRIVHAGQFSTDVQADLNRLKRGLAVTNGDAARFLKSHAEGLFRECVTMALQDGVVTAEELRMIDWLQEEAGLSDAQVAPFRREIRDAERRNAYREGKLPTVHTSKLLEGGETCHLDQSCRYEYQTTKKSYMAHGELLVTSKKIAFLSPSKSITFQPSKILDLALYSGCLEVKCSSRQGTGHYIVDDPRTLEAILTGVVRKHKFLLSESYSTTRTRHIPDDVKREVWDRDGGRCARCGASDYLEFDHVIPHSRGGANTVGNVQLLCRRCNNLKSDRI